MKKHRSQILLAAAVLVCALLAVFFCNRRADEPLEIAVTEEPRYDWGITVRVSYVTELGLTLTVTQSGGEPPEQAIAYQGAPYTIEVKRDDAWYVLPQIGEFGDVNTIAKTVPVGGELTDVINWSRVYGKLSGGEYRLKFYLYVDDRDRQPYYAYFEVG